MEPTIAEQALLKSDGDGGVPAQQPGVIVQGAVVVAPHGPNETLVNPVTVVARLDTQREHRGMLVTRLSAASLGLMLLSSIVALVALSQFTTATTTRPATVSVCSETRSGRCTNHRFAAGWCSPGDITLAGRRRVQDSGGENTAGAEPAVVSIGFPSSSVSNEELPCPDGFLNPDVLAVEGLAIALLWVLAMGTMAAFPGCCSCDPATGRGCTGKTALRLLSFVLSWVVCAISLLVGGVVTPYLYVEDRQVRTRPLSPLLY
jgi:hypothetical protein